MFDDLKKEGVIVELKDLINKADELKTDMDAYCEFMKEVFLGTSSEN